jgi:hypothetical protein
VSIWGGQHDQTMPCEELQVQGWRDEESRCYQMKRPVERYRHAMGIIRLEKWIKESTYT